ncbi:polysaccharide deacetylase family protein [Pedobacter nutrimenti]|jgi:peptidoglycan/xylan/chitin deacetylase (PgdA/CDA1 family)|uniref:Uncharacterized protein DUF3473 n=1 Tax=Pedobacter nutrimenti TaxID=1241337 RepID=A0A318U6S7_9SPHI|nr:polysaccharide deacetylase family protein [Pedobacter nutrimenti]PYF68870.1 uncharacterized protein DUF3473 [Pedobacter nutrimenti]
MVLLSFDIEEFDMAFEYGKSISFQEQISISVTGTQHILDLLQKHEIKATFFCTATFAQHAPEIISRILDEGHELASHGYYHSDFKPEHLLESRLELERLSGRTVTGYRMARMMPVDEEEVRKAGYVYNSSINPTWLPGRYNNLHISRTYFNDHGVLQLPASVSPQLRFPLFWLSFHNLPLWLYKYLVKRTIRKDVYLNVYFHPWEFTDLRDKNKFGFPSYVSRNSGKQMISRMDNFMSWVKKQHYKTGTIRDFVSSL